MATKGCYILSRLAFIFLLLFLLWQKWHLSNRLPWNRGYIYRDCVLLLIFTSPVRHLFKERKWVMVTSHDMNDLICLKLLHAIFFFFLWQPFHFLSLIDRRKGSVISQHKHVEHITGKLIENAQKKRKDAHIHPRPPCMLQTISAVVAEVKKKKTLQVPPL